MDIYGSINNYQRGELAATARIYLEHKHNYNEVVDRNHGLQAIGRELQRLIGNAMQPHPRHYFSDDDLYIVAQLINLMGEGYVARNE